MVLWWAHDGANTLHAKQYNSQCTNTKDWGYVSHRGKREFKTQLSHPNTPQKAQMITLKVKQHAVELLWYEANAKTMFCTG